VCYDGILSLGATADAIREAGGRALAIRRHVGGAAVRVIVDPERCEGHAHCVELAPEVFALDDEGQSRVILEHPGEELRAGVEHAARRCPRQAIVLREAAAQATPLRPHA